MLLGCVWFVWMNVIGVGLKKKKKEKINYINISLNKKLRKRK